MRRATLVLAVLLAAASAAPAQSYSFEVVDFGKRGRINQWSFVDFDGDGRSEAFLVQERQPHVYRPALEGGYDLDHPIAFDAPAGALYYDIAQVDADPRTLELILVTPRGVLMHTYKDGAFSSKPRILVMARNLVQAGQKDNLHFRDFVLDLDADGLTDIVLATGRGFEVYYQRRHKEGDPHPEGSPGLWFSRPDLLIPYEPQGSLEIDPPGLVGQIRGRLQIPDFRVEDLTGDGRLDFVLDEGRALRVFACGKDGRLETKPARVVDLSALADAGGELPRFVIRDLNDDGKPDFIVTRRREGITDIFLFGHPLDTPTRRLRIPGWSFDPRLSDLNNDGRLDLVIPTTPDMDIGTALSVVVTGAITVKSHIFLNTGKADAPFRNEPDHKREIRVKLRLYVDLTGSIKAAHSVLVEYEGDFDGDGRKDLVHLGDTDELLFFRGEDKEIFDDRPYRVVEIPDTEEFATLETTVRELNGDGRQDLAILYVSRCRTKDRLVVLLSRKD